MSLITTLTLQQQLEAEMEIMTAELVNSQDQLLALHELTQSMQHCLHLDDALEELARTATCMMKVQASFVILNLPERPFHITYYPKSDLGTAVLHNWFARVQTTEQPLLWNAADTIEALPPNVDNLLILPIQIKGETAATLGFINKKGALLGTPDTKLGLAIAAQASAHIENILLFEENLSQIRLHTEMSLARNVQVSLLPKNPPNTPGIEVWAKSSPALQIGGDFYDFISQPDQSLIFSAGDVSGKGLAAAMLMAMTRTTLRNAMMFGQSDILEQVIHNTNTALYDDFTEVGMFATLFVGQYLPQSRQIIYVNAGHAPVIYCPANDSARLLEADGVPIGVLPHNLSQENALFLRPGDVLVIATDGFNEARNAVGEMFGYQRLLELIEMMSNQSVSTIAETLVSAIAAFVADEPQEDDQTLVVIKGIEL